MAKKRKRKKRKNKGRSLAQRRATRKMILARKKLLCNKLLKKSM